MKTWTFAIRQYRDCSRVFADYCNADETIGGGTAFFSKADCVKWLREQQRKLHIPGNEIEWQGVDFEQMELFEVIP